MPGALDLLAQLRPSYCLATSSSSERLKLSLSVNGLAHFFQNRRFTASEVEKGKPAPDLFLHAARRMGAEPSRGVVTEDSETPPGRM